MGLQTAYELLGVRKEADADEIRNAFHERAMRFHPDRGGKLEYFLRIQRSYEILRNENLRARLGDVHQFEKLPLRLQPSLSRATSTLFENLTILEDQLRANKR
jgi:curved DNA-binding protein CbpA